MKQPSNMAAQRMFSTVPAPTIQRSTFDRSHSVKTTINGGYWYPMLVDDLLPGDTIRLDANFFARLNTMRHPIMDNLHFDAQVYTVPVRQIWDNFQKFMGEQINPTDSIDYLIPRLCGDDDEFEFLSNSIHDYMGLPVGRSFFYTGPNSVPISALYHRAYNWIYNTWMRDENLQDSVVVHRGDGPDNITDYQLLRRGKRHDYITSALPWAQKGEPVNLPLGTMAPVVPDTSNFPNSAIPTGGWSGTADISGFWVSPYASSGYSIGLSNIATPPPEPTSVPMVWGEQTGLVADLALATAITVNDLRTAVAVQQLLELYARGGTRYVELLKAEYGVTSPDYRLQRPEFLGGSTTSISVSTVPQTNQTSAESPQANLAAYGTASDRLRVSYNSTEHQILIVMVNIRADLTYQSVVNRMWTKQTRYDMMHPAFAHLGEQALFGYEVNYIEGASAAYNNSVFGYQERYAEYRYKPSLITGLMRTHVTGSNTSLDVWHLSQDLGTGPVYLNAEFIVEDPPIDRILAVTDEPEFNLDCWFNYKHTRPLPVRSIPGLRRF